MTANRGAEQRHAWWVVVAIVIAAMWTFSACGSSDEPNASSGGVSSSSGTSSGSTGNVDTDSGPTTSDGGSSSGDSDARRARARPCSARQRVMASYANRKGSARYCRSTCTPRIASACFPAPARP